MLFTDPVYVFLFLPVVLALCHVASRFKRPVATLSILVLASIIFYSGWGIDYLVMLLISVAVNWLCAHLLLQIGDTQSRNRKLILVAGETFNFAALAWFKYSYFLFNFTDGTAALSAGTIAIPIGISFYTFQQAVFLLDAYRRDEAVVGYLGEEDGRRSLGSGFIRYAAFVIFFPQLVIGPIVYLKEFAPQVASRTFGRLNRTDLEVGTFLFCVGLFKKVVLADNLAIMVDDAYVGLGPGQSVDLIQAWTAALGYYAQLYFDFSGYSDMALGSARMFGIKLPINFASPLKATSIADFYRRWHITLTRVIARFFYTPLSVWGTRFAFTRIKPKFLHRFPIIWIPFIVNFEVIALWHGATANFLLFGTIHSLWYVLETEIRQTRAWKKWKGQSSEALRDTLGRVIFFIPMVLCFSLFRADNVATWMALSSSMFAFDSVATALADTGQLRNLGLCVTALLICLCFLVPGPFPSGIFFFGQLFLQPLQITNMLFLRYLAPDRIIHHPQIL